MSARKQSLDFCCQLRDASSPVCLLSSNRDRIIRHLIQKFFFYFFSRLSFRRTIKHFVFVFVFVNLSRLLYSSVVCVVRVSEITPCQVCRPMQTVRVSHAETRTVIRNLTTLCVLLLEVYVLVYVFECMYVHDRSIELIIIELIMRARLMSLAPTT